MNGKFVLKARDPMDGKTTIISVRLPESMVDELEKVAGKTGKSRNEVVHLALRFALDNLEIEE